MINGRSPNGGLEILNFRLSVISTDQFADSVRVTINAQKRAGRPPFVWRQKNPADFCPAMRRSRHEFPYAI